MAALTSKPIPPWAVAGIICVVIVLIVGVFYLMYRGPERTGPVIDRAKYGDHRKNTSEPPTQR